MTEQAAIKLVSREIIARAPSLDRLNRWSETYIEKSTYDNGKTVYVLNTHTTSHPMDDIYRAWKWFAVDTGVFMPEADRQVISRKEYQAMSDEFAARVAGKRQYGIRRCEADAELSVFRPMTEAEEMELAAIMNAGYDWEHVTANHQDSAAVCNACACLIANDDADMFSNSFTEKNARIGIASWCNEWNTLSIDHDKTDRDTSFKCDCCGERIHGEKFHLVLANFRN